MARASKRQLRNLARLVVRECQANDVPWQRSLVPVQPGIRTGWRPADMMLHMLLPLTAQSQRQLDTTCESCLIILIPATSYIQLLVDDSSNLCD